MRLKSQISYTFPGDPNDLRPLRTTSLVLAPDGGAEEWARHGVRCWRKTTRRIAIEGGVTTWEVNRISKWTGMPEKATIRTEEQGRLIEASRSCGSDGPSEKVLLIDRETDARWVYRKEDGEGRVTEISVRSWDRAGRLRLRYSFSPEGYLAGWASHRYDALGRLEQSIYAMADDDVCFVDLFWNDSLSRVARVVRNLDGAFLERSERVLDHFKLPVEERRFKGNGKLISTTTYVNEYEEDELVSGGLASCQPAVAGIWDGWFAPYIGQ